MKVLKRLQTFGYPDCLSSLSGAKVRAPQHVGSQSVGERQQLQLTDNKEKFSLPVLFYLILLSTTNSDILIMTIN